MILLYHKVDVQAPTAFWVSADRFFEQMSALRSYDVVTLDDYDPGNPRHAVITFDGVYENVVRFAAPILKHFGYPYELFIIGDYVGQGNEFDQKVEPPARFADLEQLEWCAKRGGRIQWHSKSHPRLSGLSPDALNAELSVPASLRERFGAGHFGWFAFPHGEHDEDVINAVKERYDGALSCIAGNETDRYSLNRITVKESTNWKRPTVSIIIPNYNYGAYLPEAIDSVLAQTVPADEVLIIDDASTDGSREILNAYADKARIEINSENLGIVENFRKAVSMTSGDYVAFVGADNRIRADFIEKCRSALDRNEDAAVAYTDLIMFGPRAGMMSNRENVTVVAESMGERWPLLLRRYPDPTPEVLSRFKTHNFVHGSSMFRRRDYEAVGGYESNLQAEDHNLFYRIHKLGRKFIHIPEPLLEYRQHSAKQANTVLGLEMQNRILRQRAKALEKELSSAQQRLREESERIALLEDRERILHAQGQSHHAATPLQILARTFRAKRRSVTATGINAADAAVRKARRGARKIGARKSAVTLSDFEVAIVHYRQVRPTVAMLNAFFDHYPEQTVTLVDNSGGECSVHAQILPHLEEERRRNIRVLVNPAKEHGSLGPLSHGAGIDFAIAHTARPYLISMETDTFVLKRGGLEFLADLARQGYDWAGLGQKPYKGRFASFSPSFAFFRLAPIRRHGLSFRVKHRTSEDIFAVDLLLKHHLDVAQRLREGKEIEYPEGKPPDTYRRELKQIINAELQHLSYFDTGEWVHYALTREGYRGKLFEPIDSVCHSWGSRDEKIFLENFTHNLPHLDLNDFLPPALQIASYQLCELACLDVRSTGVVPGGERAHWAAVGVPDVKASLSECGLTIRIPNEKDRVYVGMGSQAFDKPPAEETGALLSASKEYQLRCKSRVKDSSLQGELWLIEYGSGRRLKSHRTPLRADETRLSFTTTSESTHFRIFWRFSGGGEALIEKLELWQRG